MKKKFFIPLLIVAFAFFFSNCDKKDDSNDNLLLLLLLTQSKGTISFTVSGQQVSMSTPDGFGSGLGLLLAGFGVDINNSIVVSMPSAATQGTVYNESSTSFIFGYTRNGIMYGNTTGHSFTFTVTSKTTNSISATFSGALYGMPGELTLTNGTLSASITSI